MRDIGFGAEEVNAVEPLLTTRNEKGEIEGVKYPQITTVLVNAVNEQQANIEAIAKRNDQLENRVRELSAQNQKLRAEMDALLKIVCSMNSTAEICKEER
jgi:uncharacterized coiled-coil DUF342 family protein